MKTKKSAAKRFRKTRTGKLLHVRQAQRHLASKKSARRMRRLARSKKVDGADKKTVDRLLPYE